MKRILSIAFAAALLCQAVIAFADDQDPNEPSEKSVLQAAREKYWSKRQSEPAAESPEASEAAAGAEREDFPFTPIQISLVPGLSLPSGIYDTVLSVGMIANISRDVSGAQASGVFNIARNLRGAQGAGVFNIADGRLKGVQSAGVFNIAERIEGVQAAGVFNVAGEVDGLQVGLVNFARKVEGMQIGLFNYAVNGVHSLGVAYEPQSSYAYAYWQSGTRSLYTRWSLGAPCRDWELEYGGAVADFGIGSRHSVSMIDLDVDVSAECAMDDIAFDREGERRGRDGCGESRPWPRSYPSVRAEASLPVGNSLRIFGGIKSDIDVEALGERVPEELKKGNAWRGRLWGGDFTVWPKWFFGLKIY